jgi:hypothetical protein
MSIIENKNPSYLVKHRRKWQVKLTIPRDVRWAFDNKTTFKRSTGYNIIDTERALVERDKIVTKFKENVELHRSNIGVVSVGGDVSEDNDNNRDHSDQYHTRGSVDAVTEKIAKSEVDGWIKERLLKKAGNSRVLRYDFWRADKKKV